MAANKPKKNQALKNNEYYNTQALFDDLYERSQRGEISTHLMELIASEQNILLAYRAIKKNKGSKTKGTNSTTGHSHHGRPYHSAVYQASAGANLRSKIL